MRLFVLLGLFGVVQAQVRFGPANVITTTTFSYSDVSICDWNNDGTDDFVTTPFSGTTDAAYLNIQTSPGAFNAPITLNNGIATSRSCNAIHDVNGDGFDDLAIGYFGNGDIHFFINTGGVGAISSPFVLPGPGGVSGVREIVFEDIDGDGNLDLVAGYANTGQLRIYYGNPTAANFFNPAFFTVATVVPDVIGLQCRDFDNDGDIDIAAGMNGGVRVYSNTSTLGNFSFATPQIIPSPGGVPVNEIIAADFYGTGRLDIAYSIRVTGEIYLTQNMGTPLPNMFAAPTLVAPNVPEIGLLNAGDLDNDGDPDLAFGMTIVPGVGYSINEGGGNFCLPLSIDCNFAATSLRLRDINQDGRLDVITTETNQVAPFLGRFAYFLNIACPIIDVTICQTPLSSPSASDGSITFTSTTGGTPPYSFALGRCFPFGPNPTFNSLASGTYYPLAKDVNGCPSKVQQIDISTGPIFGTTLTTTPATCAASNGQIDLTVTGGTPPLAFTLNGNPATPPFTGLAAGNYTLVVTDANGCQQTLTPTVGIAPPTLSTTLTTTPATCAASNGQIDLTVTGGTPPLAFTLNGNPATPPFTGLAAGNYTLVVTDANGCQQTLTPTVGALNLIITTAVTDASCADASDGVLAAVPLGTPPYLYSWTGPAGFSNGDSLIAGLLPGDYSLTVTDNLGCTANEDVSIGFGEAVQADFTPEGVAIPVLLPENNATVGFLNTSQNATAFQWVFGDGTDTLTTLNASHTYTIEGTYEVVLIARNGPFCADTARLQVVVQPRFSFFIPTVFSPNGDGHNDLFGPIPAAGLQGSLVLFNRWGSQIALLSSLEWNGTDASGQMVPEGVYVYRLEVVDINNTLPEIVRVGTITLLR